MPKWISPLFSDIRNELGETVVFSNWKGRPYFRSYVIPANPNTNKQKARRQLMKELVKRYQAVVVTDDEKAAWNSEALPYQVSGFNLFCKFGLKSKISCPATGTTTDPVTITYTLGLPANKARVYAYDGSTWIDITPAEGLEAGENKTFQHTFSSAGTYEIFIADGDVLVEGDSSPQDYQAITEWAPDYTTGTVKKAEITIS